MSVLCKAGIAACTGRIQNCIRWMLVGWLAMLQVPAPGQIVQIPSGTNSKLNSIEQFGGDFYFLGDLYLSRTQDEGASLEHLNVPAAYNLTYGLRISEIGDLFLISARRFPYYDYRIYRSTDDGDTWALQFEDTTNGTLEDITSLGPDFLIAAGWTDRVVVSTDTGHSWAADTISAFPGYLEYFVCDSYGDSTILLLGLEYCKVSQDRGDSWTSSFLYQYLPTASSIVSRDTMYVLRVAPQADETELSRSYNGGQHWDISQIGSDIGLYGVTFRSASHGYAVGYDVDRSEGIILETRDYGDSWVHYSIGMDAALLDVESINESELFVVGNNGTILKVNMDGLEPLHVESKYDIPGFRVSPNPSGGRILIQGSARAAAYLSLVNLQGIIVRSVEYQGVDVEMGLMDLPKGMYILIARDRAGAILWQDEIVLH